MPTSEIIAVGSELLTPLRLDTNSLYITRRLNDIGILVQRKWVVGDEPASLEEALRIAMRRVSTVLITGGLGPTEDDITRKVAAHVLDRQLIYNEEIAQKLRERFARVGRALAENNLRQALVPMGAIILPNSVGTAPGLWLEEGKKKIVLLPGPPREMKRMLDEHVIPRLASATRGEPILRRVIKLAGIPESTADERIAPIYLGYPKIQTTILAAPGQIEVHLTAVKSIHPQAEYDLDRLQDQIEEALGDKVFSTEDKTLEEVVGIFLGMRQGTLAVAESCTGGLIAKRLTDVPGSSQYFNGGVVTYSDQSKIDLLGVDPEQLRQHGAVSAVVAEQMADGVRRRFGSTFGLSATGIAGPSGGSEEKPVGLVFLGWSDSAHCHSERIQFNGDRELVRQFAAQNALNMARRNLV